MKEAALRKRNLHEICRGSIGGPILAEGTAIHRKEPGSAHMAPWLSVGLGARRSQFNSQIVKTEL